MDKEDGPQASRGRTHAACDGPFPRQVPTSSPLLYSVNYLVSFSFS